MRIVGVDPGSKTGLAVYDKTLKRILEIRTTDFWGCYKYLKDELHDGLIQKVIIEVPKTKSNWHKKSCDITSANIGGIFREAKLLADGIEGLGYEVIRVHPPGKVDCEYVKRLTGWTGKTNEHTGDAIMLCWGF
jgi:hypothetical protein